MFETGSACVLFLIFFFISPLRRDSNKKIVNKFSKAMHLQHPTLAK